VSEGVSGTPGSFPMYVRGFVAKVFCQSESTQIAARLNNQTLQIAVLSPTQHEPACLTKCLLRAAHSGVSGCLSQIVLLDVAQLCLRRPIHDKASGDLRFAALATKPGEISGVPPAPGHVHV